MKFQKRVQTQIDNETEIMKAEYHAGLPVPVPLHKIEQYVKEKKANDIPPEDNMIMVTWFDDPENLQNEHDVSKPFVNSNVGI